MTATDTATTISLDELARNLPDILERVRKQGERFAVKDGDEVIAIIHSGLRRKGITLSELIERVGNLQTPGDGFGDDLEAIRSLMQYPKAPDWPD